MSTSDSISAVIEQWSGGSMAKLIAARLDIPADEPMTAPVPGHLGPGVRKALELSGIDHLYQHQVDGIEHVEARRNVVVSTPTASGKSLCYTVPIVHALESDPRSSALLIFPTKALERDQGKGLTTMLEAAGVEVTVAAYDGDASADARRMARSRGRVILTNPDMLHLGMLPHHTSWSTFLSGLRHIVIDELHQYRGVFGSHLANVLRRLARVLHFHGAHPTWIASSATIDNPAQLAEALTGQPFELVSTSGAPTGKRTVMFMSPQVLDPVTGVRGSYMHLAARAASDLVAQNLQTLVFAQSRRGVEIALRYVRGHVRKQGLEPETVQGYRGGYLPELRRRIEDGLKNGSLRCVVATNALELGVDIGSLDAVVLAGYPGSVSSTWQRIGRAGRRREPSMAVYVGSASPLDQFMISHVDWLASASPEKGLVNPDNLEIVLEHIKCATFELPFESGEPFGTLGADEVQEILEHFSSTGLVHEAAGVHHWVADEYPGASVNLRSIGPEPFVILDETVSTILGEVEGRSVYSMLHEQAIYQHAGLPYIVEKLDLDRRRAHVREVEPEYYTTPIVATTITPIDQMDTRASRTTALHLGEVRIDEQVTGFKKIRYGSHENLGTGEVDLPRLQMEAFGVWLEVLGPGGEEGTKTLTTRLEIGDPIAVVHVARSTGSSTAVVPSWVMEGLAGLGHLLRHIASLRLMCDPHDLVPVMGTGTQDWSNPGAGDGSVLPALYLHESHPGGVGLAEKLYDTFDEVGRDALDALLRCPCKMGCPSCVGPPDRDDEVRKQASRIILEFVSGHVH